MTTPADIQEHLSVLFTVLPKMAILINTYSGQKHFVTHCNKIIKLFQKEYNKEKYFIKDLNSPTIECYELRYDKYVTIDVSDIHYTEFLGVPSEVAPPLYTNPVFAGMIPDEQLYELQEPSLLEVLEMRDRGCFIEVPYDENRVITLKRILRYLTEKIKIPLDSYPAFKMFQNHLLNDLLLYSNIVDGDEIMRISEKLYFMPAILACYGQDAQNLTTDKITQYITTDIGDLKNKWVEKLDFYRDKNIKDLHEEASTVSQHLVSELKTKLTIQAICTYVQKHTPSACTTYQETMLATEEYNTAIENFVAMAVDRYNDEFLPVEQMLPNAEAVVNSVLSMLRGIYNTPTEVYISDDPQYLAAITNSLMSTAVGVINRFEKIKEQYVFLADQLQQIDFLKELSGFDDYRLYLRYWPNAFQQNESFHDAIRPFTSLEFKVVQCLINEGVKVNYDEIFPTDFFRSESDFYHSVLHELQDKVDVMREKRLEQIETAAQQRIKEIKSEMDQMYDDLAEEEKILFTNMLDDIGDIDKYRKELETETYLLNVLMYWPLELYPKPDNIIQA